MPVALGFDRHSLLADPLFIALEKDDYRLNPNSPAFKLGFQPIPVEKIGLVIGALAFFARAGRPVSIMVIASIGLIRCGARTVPPATG